MLKIELGELPKAIKVLGEDLVIFRDKTGHIGLLNKFCSHRGVSLEFGLVAEHGIRCCYHGWLFDVDGKVLETPAEPPNSPLKCEFNQGAYPVRESGPFIFAYMGPPEAMPPLPEFETFTYPNGNELAPYRLEWPCNWLQIQENAASCHRQRPAILAGLQRAAGARFHRYATRLPRGGDPAGEGSRLYSIQRHHSAEHRSGRTSE
jgi:phenylpropionate dioxygenase-like ring-hydroxylating dioxygenase large terminal subunit